MPGTDAPVTLMTDEGSRQRPANARFVDALVADARPVRRLWPPAMRVLVWLAFGLAVLGWSVGSGVRSDLAEQLRHPAFVLEVGTLLLGAALLAALAFAAAVPGRAPSRSRFLLAMAFATGAWLLPVRCPAESAIPLARFLEMALACERRTTLLALPSLGILLLGVRRGAPLASAVAGSLAGAAAFLLAAANMRLLCPIDARFHLLVGHSLPGVAGIAVTAALGAAWLGRWRLVSVARLSG